MVLMLCDLSSKKTVKISSMGTVRSSVETEGQDIVVTNEESIGGLSIVGLVLVINFKQNHEPTGMNEGKKSESINFPLLEF